MDKAVSRKILLPLIFIFIAINSLCLVFNNRLNASGFSTDVIIAANLILFLLAIITAFMHLKALKNINPHVFVRSIMGATILKLLVIAGAAFIYLYAAGESRSAKAVLAGVGLYFIYTIFEVRMALRLNKQNNGSR